MGWAYCGVDDRGRPIGYGIEATCDQDGCDAEIDRGLSYCCGDMHGGGSFGCGGYFCEKHLLVACVFGELHSLCQACSDCYPGSEDSDKWPRI